MQHRIRTLHGRVSIVPMSMNLVTGIAIAVGLLAIAANLIHYFFQSESELFYRFGRKGLGWLAWVISVCFMLFLLTLAYLGHDIRTLFEVFVAAILVVANSHAILVRSRGSRGAEKEGGGD